MGHQRDVSSPASTPHDDFPVACDPHVFSEDQRSAHLELSTDVIVRWPTKREELPSGYAFTYQGTEARFLALAGWAAAEHRCCPWASYSVELSPFAADQPGTIRVRVTANDDGKAFLTAAYEYLAQLQGSRPPDSIMNPDGKLRTATLLEKLKAGCGC